MKSTHKSYRTFLAISLLFVYVISPFKIYAPYISYKVNYKYIAGVLCQNKEKPKMQCNGKCHLKKELKKSAKEESKNKSQVSIFEQEELLILNVYCLVEVSKVIEYTHHFLYLSEYSSAALAHITPPPQV